MHSLMSKAQNPDFFLLLSEVLQQMFNTRAEQAIDPTEAVTRQLVKIKLPSALINYAVSIVCRLSLGHSRRHQT